MGGFMARMTRLVLDRETAQRVRNAARRVKALGLSKTRMVREIGRSRQNVTGMLNRTVSSPGTLSLIEGLLDEVEAGRVVV